MCQITVTELRNFTDIPVTNTFLQGADKSLTRPGRKQATSMSKSSWMMDPTCSREMPSCSAIELAEIQRSSKISLVNLVNNLRGGRAKDVSAPRVIHINFIFFFSAAIRFWVMTSPYGTSRSHSLDNPHSVGLLWTSDQPYAETSSWQHTTLTTDKYPCPRLDSNPRSQQASARRPTP
jgi:hypothetical protein